MGRSRLSALLMPEGVERGALILLVARGLRGMCDGFIAVLLPGYLLALGFGQLAVGLISTTTLFGSAFATVLVGLAGNRFTPERFWHRTRRMDVHAWRCDIDRRL
jgi:MFS family permease